MIVLFVEFIFEYYHDLIGFSYLYFIDLLLYFLFVLSGNWIFIITFKAIGFCFQSLMFWYFIIMFLI